MLQVRTLRMKMQSNSPMQQMRGKTPVHRVHKTKNFCANCKGEHATNYGKCPKNPKNIQKTQETQQQKQRKIPIKPIQKNISFSEMIKKTNTQTPQKNTPQTQTQKPKTLNTELPPNDLFSQSFEEIESKVRFYYAMVNKYRDSPK